MHTDQVIVVEAVLCQQLPVCTDVVVLQALYHLHLPGRRLVDDDVDIFLCAGKVVLERHRVGVEIEEYETAVRRYARRLLQGEVALVEARRIGVLSGHAVELAVPVIAPPVVEAGMALRIALGLAADDAAAVAARIEEDTDPALAIAAEYDRSVAYDARPEVARRTHLRFVPDVNPADIEDAPPLELQYLRVYQCRAVDLEAHRFRFVDHPVLVHRASLARLLSRVNFLHNR